MQKTLDFIIENWALISALIPVVYELIARRVPTEKDISIINNIKKVADAVVTNVKKDKESNTLTKH